MQTKFKAFIYLKANWYDFCLRYVFYILVDIFLPALETVRCTGLFSSFPLWREPALDGRQGFFPDPTRLSKRKTSSSSLMTWDAEYHSSFWSVKQKQGDVRYIMLRHNAFATCPQWFTINLILRVIRCECPVNIFHRTSEIVWWTDSWVLSVYHIQFGTNGWPLNVLVSQECRIDATDKLKTEVFGS